MCHIHVYMHTFARCTSSHSCRREVSSAVAAVSCAISRWRASTSLSGTLAAFNRSDNSFPLPDAESTPKGRTVSASVCEQWQRQWQRQRERQGCYPWVHTLQFKVRTDPLQFVARVNQLAFQPEREIHEMINRFNGHYARLPTQPSTQPLLDLFSREWLNACKMPVHQCHQFLLLNSQPPGFSVALSYSVHGTTDY